MKLLFINPFFSEQIMHFPPLELGYIATYIRDKTNCSVEIIDPLAQGLTEKEVLDRAKESEIIGLCCFTERRFECFDLAEKIKKANPFCKLIIGGPHATILDELILKHYPFIDGIVRGEGEETMLEIIKDRPFQEILGLTWKENGKIIRNANRPLIGDINSLYIDYSLLPTPQSYQKDIDDPYRLGRKRFLYMLFSRGCLFQCKFCGGPLYWGRTQRRIDPEELVRRMGELVEKYKIEYFRFCDGLFIGKEEWVFNFCRLLEKSKLNIKFRIDTRVGATREILKYLKKVGCISIVLGIESGSERILREINKLTTVAQIIKTAQICKELGFWTTGAFILGLPGETVEDVRQTFKLTKLFDVYGVFIYHLFPGTEIYNELKQKGEIRDEVWFDKKYGGLINYYKDYFPSASFYEDELLRIWRDGYYQHLLSHPFSHLRRWGLFRGVPSLFFPQFRYGSIKVTMMRGIKRILKLRI